MHWCKILENFEVQNGVRQACILSPRLFIGGVFRVALFRGHDQTRIQTDAQRIISKKVGFENSIKVYNKVCVLKDHCYLHRQKTISGRSCFLLLEVAFESFLRAMVGKLERWPVDLVTLDLTPIRHGFFFCVLCLSWCCELITYTWLSVTIMKLKQSLTVMIPYTPPSSEQEIKK